MHNTTSVCHELLKSDERLVLEAYQQLVPGEYRPLSIRREGPCPPPGWMIDLNDPVLMTYDPYFGTERKDDAAPQQFIADRYYARDALPLAKPTSFRCSTEPPACSQVHNAMKGRYVVANRAIKAGEVVAMDTSVFSVVHDSRSFLHCPPPPVGAPPLGDHTKQLHAAAKRMLRSAQMLRGFPESIVATSRVQLLCSLLVTRGDLLALPRRKGQSSKSGRRCACGGTSFFDAFCGSSLPVHASFRVEKEVDDVLQDWWRTEYNLAVVGSTAHHHHHQKKDATLLHQSKMLIQLMPKELLRDTSIETTCCGTRWRAYGFFARLGLHDPRTLSAWLSAWDANAVGVHVPDLLSRSALFPFMRLLEHSCRPNCSLIPMDAPVTHTSWSVGAFNYDTKADDTDPYEDNTRAKRTLSAKQLAQLWWPCETTQAIYAPSVAMLTANRDISCGEALSISYIPATYMRQAERQAALLERYQFACTCRWCVSEPDLARGFRCPKCPTNQGVVCPVADGSQWDCWECLQCGYHPDVETEIPRMLDAEVALGRVKADKARGLVALLDDPFVHYSHAIVFRKLDAWSEQSWKAQDPNMCIGLIEALQRCARRVMDPCDASRAQYHEFMGQVHHAVGNAHTSRHEYFTAYQIRLRSGSRLAHWTRKTQFMAAEKGLADLLDSR